MPARRRSRHANELLARLAPPDLAALDGDLEPVALIFKQTLHEQNRPIKQVYFPTSGVVSLVTVLDDRGEVIETGTVGREGFVGVPAFLGAALAPGRALCQVPGDALRIDIGPFHEAVRRIQKLRSVLMLYTHVLLAMVAQSAGCIGAHPVEARMARWLLMTQDRAESDEFPLTQQFLGQMLGVHRSAVNLAGQALQDAGIISYSRGRMKIVDRAGLEAAACECYDHIRRELERTLARA